MTSSGTSSAAARTTPATGSTSPPVGYPTPVVLAAKTSLASCPKTSSRPPSVTHLHRSQTLLGILHRTLSRLTTSTNQFLTTVSALRSPARQPKFSIVAALMLLSMLSATLSALSEEFALQLHCSSCLEFSLLSALVALSSRNTKWSKFEVDEEDYCAERTGEFLLSI